MPDLLFAFLALFGFGFKDVLNKLILKKLDVYSTLLSEYFLSMFLLASSVFVFSTLVFPDKNVFLLLLLSSIIGSAAIVSYFKAVQLSKVGLVFSIAGSYPFFAVLFSML